MLELSGAETTSGVAELEWPQEVGGLLEVGANSEDLVDQILHADNAVLAEVGLDERVVGKSNALLLNLSVTALVDELTDGLEVGVSIGDPWLDDLQHLKGSLGHANKDTIVDLEKTEKLEDLSGLGSDLVDTIGLLACLYKKAPSDNLPLNTDNEDQLLLSRDIEGSILLRKSAEADLLALSVTVLLHVLLGTLEDNTTLLLCGLLMTRLALSLFWNAEAGVTSRLQFRPERWLIGDSIDTEASSRKNGVMHHKSSQTSHTALEENFQRTFRFLSSSAAFSSLAFSWLLRFLRRVSGTRIWSTVGTVLCQVSLIVPHTKYGEERRVGIAAIARHSRIRLTRWYEFNR